MLQHVAGCAICSPTAPCGARNRLGVILGPIVVGAIIGSGGSLAMVFTRLGCVAVAGAVVAWFAVETKGRTLEELNS
ncbi:hypothetical protein P6B95_33240 [Streptomyces atratus]|uniref:hypothetical protein n=1 Tax=Streptomyces atratus TaxID=1893 RepID=UPI002AC31E00|nr:hypothetical protein [Streptomyces atratus]WPW31779.1 hypothetical protein P6B95_33240 [Streptomyces atratus]